MVGLLLVAAAGAAAQDLRLPPLPLADRRGHEVNDWLQLKPYVRVGAHYTDNLFQQRSARRRGDTVYALTPGLDVRMGDDDVWAEVGYAPTVLVFHHEGGLSTVEQRLRYIGHAKVGALELDSSGAATWALFNSDPQFTGRVRNFQGSVNLDAAYGFDEVWGARASAFAVEARNFPDALEPTNTQEWGTSALLTAAPNVGPALSLRAGATFREVHYLDHRARQPDLSLAGAVAGAKLELEELLRLEALGGVEFPWVKKRNGVARGVNPDPAPILNLTAALFPVRGAELLLAVRHRLAAAAAAAWQRSTTASAALALELPADLGLRLVASGTLLAPRRAAEIRVQSYQAILTWGPWEHLELGVQGGYTRQSARGGGFEALSVGAAITLSL